MHRISLTVVLVIAACAAPPSPVVGYRDPDAPIYSSAVFDLADIAGGWRQVADFAPTPGCTASGLRFGAAPAGLQAEGVLCLAGQRRVVTGPLTALGPGRFALAGVPEALWVLWADTDRRTLVLGTPSGRFGVILNRDAVVPPDRLVAAREVLAWNGYDLDRLQITR